METDVCRKRICPSDSLLRRKRHRFSPPQSEIADSRIKIEVSGQDEAGSRTSLTAQHQGNLTFFLHSTCRLG